MLNTCRLARKNNNHEFQLFKLFSIEGKGPGRAAPINPMPTFQRKLPSSKTFPSASVGTVPDFALQVLNPGGCFFVVGSTSFWVCLKGHRKEIHKDSDIYIYIYILGPPVERLAYGYPLFVCLF